MLIYHQAASIGVYYTNLRDIKKLLIEFVQEKAFRKFFSKFTHV